MTEQLFIKPNKSSLLRVGIFLFNHSIIIMTKEEFIRKCNNVVQKYRDPATFNKCIEEILASGCIDLDKVPQDYRPAYWVVGAMLARTFDECINGSVYENERRKARRESKNISYFIPTWW